MASGVAMCKGGSVD